MTVALAFLRQHWQAVLCAALAFAVMMLQLRLDAVTAEHKAYVASVELAAGGAEAKKVERESVQTENLRTIEENHDEKHVQAVRARAVDAVRGSRLQQRPAGSGGAMPGIAARVEADDGAGKECGSFDALVADAAEDADTLTAWQEWARLNEIPVRP